jgi:peptidoglycan/xylan/chitin deacetylase (PgdA/CDA1 family)
MDRFRFGSLVVLLVVLFGCGGSARPRAAFLSDAFAVPARRAEVVIGDPSPAVTPPLATPEAAPRRGQDLVRCAREEKGPAPIMDRGDAATPGKVALTFDDGPVLGHTPKVLDALAAVDMKATFFVVGRAINAQTYDIVQRTVAEGHALAIHSYNHEVEMATRYGEAKSRRYIAGQFEVTRVLVDLALVATSEEDFDALYARVFGLAPYAWIADETLASDLTEVTARHRAVLEERGYTGGARPYDVVFWRPPGGGPYLSSRPGPARATYDAALERLGVINVMWHGGAGDTDEHRRKDRGFLVGNLRHATKQGGVLLLHDAIDKPALVQGLAEMRALGARVVPLEDLARETFGC